MALRFLATFLLILGLAVTARADGGTDDPAPPAPPANAAAEHRALTEEYNKARQAWYREYAEYRKKAQAGQTGAPPPSPDREFAVRHVKASIPYAGTEEAVPFLMSAVGFGRSGAPEIAKRALDVLLEKHVASPRLATMVHSLMYGVYTMGTETVDRAAARIVEGNPTPEVRAAYLFLRGALVNRDGSATDEQKRAAVGYLGAVAEVAPESAWAARAQGTLTELTRLQIGLEAPDIEGEDLDGVPFKLSDYRGKVVVLDFWGDW
jgi:hypothetical protein